jgi:hypothetical protein
MDMAMGRGRVRIGEENKLLKIVLENFSILERIIYQPQEAPENNSGIMMPCCFFLLRLIYFKACKASIQANKSCGNIVINNLKSLDTCIGTGRLSMQRITKALKLGLRRFIKKYPSSATTTVVGIRSVHSHVC